MPAGRPALPAFPRLPGCQDTRLLNQLPQKRSPWPSLLVLPAAAPPRPARAVPRLLPTRFAAAAAAAPPPGVRRAAGDWGAAWDIFEGIAPVEGTEEFPQLEELLGWDPAEEEKERRRQREESIRVGGWVGRRRRRRCWALLRVGPAWAAPGLHSMPHAAAALKCWGVGCLEGRRPWGCRPRRPVAGCGAGGLARLPRPAEAKRRCCCCDGCRRCMRRGGCGAWTPLPGARTAWESARRAWRWCGSGRAQVGAGLLPGAGRGGRWLARRWWEDTAPC